MDLLALFDEHYSGLYRFAHRMTGSAADAEDIVQECFLAMLRPNCQFDPERTPARPYLYGIVRNQALKRRPKATIDLPEPNAAPTPESCAVQSETEEAVMRAVRQLPEGQREALILTHYEHMPLADVARVMNIEVTAVKSRLQRARAHLRETLSSYTARGESFDRHRTR